MPVPVSTTHANGVGNAGAVSEELQTQGPFARLKRPAAAQSAENGDAQPADGPADASGKAAADDTCQQAPTAASAEAATPPQATAAAAPIETQHLTFRYPGIGEVMGAHVDIRCVQHACTDVRTAGRWQADARLGHIATLQMGGRCLVHPAWCRT